MEPFALVEDVQRRLDFTLDDQERVAVQAALEDMSEEARYYGQQNWPEPVDAPNLVRVTVVKAVVRWARNMNGYITSKAGDETLTWADLGAEAGTPQFTKAEVGLLRALGDERGGRAFATVETYAYSNRFCKPYNGLVDTNIGAPFPLYPPRVGYPGWS